MAAQPRILYVVSEDWYFLSHRLPMARAARDANFEVHVATHVQRGAEAIRREGFRLHPIPFERGRLSIIANVRTMQALRDVYRKIDPTIAHHVSLQPSVLASLSALGRNVICVNALTGFGYTFTSNTLKARAIRPAIAGLLRLLLDRHASVALVQNPDDRATLQRLGIPDERIACIAGSGVDVERFVPTPEPTGPITFGFVGRILADKGVHTLVEAFRMLRTRGLDIELRIAGTPDPANPSSITDTELARWRTEPGLTLLGHVDDVAGFWAGVHVAVLPSRREGLPKSMIEAAACGRPMIASDVPGCREVVTSETGLLVAVDDPATLADAMANLASAPDLRRRLGAAARSRAIERFSSTQIATQTVALYRELLSARA